MAIADIARYTHLSDTDIERLSAELDAIRADVEDSLGAHDAAYIRRTIRFQRLLEVAARLLIHGSRSKPGWVLGTSALAFAKTVENMEIGHNVSHGQWDWMNDPEIHSTTWEWDMVAPASQWRYSHNYRHHVFSNVLGVDDDLGFGVMRVTPDQPWKPQYLLQPLQNVLLAVLFEWGIALHGVDMERTKAGSWSEKTAQARVLLRKVMRQTAKDYLVFPALSASRWRRVLGANVAANLLRNVWTYVVIFCGHFPDGAAKFTPDVLDQETKADWYLRQMLGAANFKAGPLMAFASGNLCYQIEHHLFPDLPSNRYAEIAARVRPLCEKYDLPYATGSLARQYFSTLLTVHRLALPDRFFGAPPDDAPERGLVLARRNRVRRRRAAKRHYWSRDSTSSAVAQPAA
jgi:fatty acid desaturase